ncbi:MAG: FlgD immunoglobulin-like domain containing protein [Candidatus Zixiibacteriota bacterium]
MKSAGIGVILYYFLAVLVLVEVSQAQIDCSAIDPSPVDTLKPIDTKGRPDSVINVPIYMANNHNLAGFEIYIAFDSSIIQPLLIGAPDTTIDTTWDIDCYWDTTGGDSTLICDTLAFYIDTFVIAYYEFDPIVSRWDTSATETELLFSETDFPDTLPNIQRIRAFAAPPFVIPQSAIDSGSGNFMTIPFHINPTAAHNTITQIRFYEETIFNYDTFPPVPIGCLYSKYTDTSGTYDVKFTTIAGTITVDTAYVPPQVPVINFFTARPSTIMEGESTYLVWNVSNATQIVISGVGTFTNLIDSTLVGPLYDTTTYTLTASNSEGEVTAQTRVNVVPYVPNNAPVFTEPTQTSYTIEQGQTLAFSVTATDADGDTLTLSAGTLPNNATFGPTDPVIGIGSVTGNFSFTPDFAQTGSFQVTFTASDGKVGGTTQLTVSINVEELQYDRLFTTSAEGQVPVGGLASTRGILLPINLITAQTVYGVQFDFFYDPEYFEVDSIITTPRTQDYVIYENIGQIPGEIRVVTFGVANEPIIPDTSSTAILYVVMTIDSLALPGDYPILIENGWESINPDPDFPSLPLVTDSGIIQVDRLGDVNLDKRIDVADAVNIVGNILGNFGFTSRQFATADVTKDSTIDVYDLVGVIDLIFGITPSPAAGQYIPGAWASVSLDYSDLPSGAEDIMVVRSELPEKIAGVQLEIRYDPATISLGKPALAEDAAKMILSSKNNGTGKLTVLLYFKNPFRTEDLIQEGEADLITIPIVARTDIQVDNNSQMKLTRALLSTASAEAVRVKGMDLPLPSTFVLEQNYPNPFNPTTTIEFSLGGTDNGPLTQHVTLDIYNILGQYVKTLMDKNLAPGNYQVEWDATNNDGQRVATGIYLYRLQVNRESKTKKMLFLK